MNRPFSFVLSLISFLLISSVAHSQTPIDEYNFDLKYLEHLVKTGVDEVRAKYDCKALINDSILYVASGHHSNYMKNKSLLTHHERDTKEFVSPQDRANYYGAKNYLVGENVLYTPYHTEVKGKKGKKFNTRTYEGLAAAMVNAWVNSPGHFKNMITKDYQITGLTVAIDPVKKRAYACQKFAQVPYTYHFEENKEMFPNSDYEPPKIPTSFDGIPSQLINPYKYDFKLKHTKLEKCANCDTLKYNQPFFTLKVVNNNFILKVENAEYVKNLIRNRRDGFAVEIVMFDDYMCGNPEYYTKPSRRNKQLKLNGKIIEPVYRNKLYKGYRKRKKVKGMKFAKYLFKADSIPFFKRFYQWKLRKYSHEYFEIKLGRVPRKLTGFWNHNLVTIQDKRICHIDYFTSYCGKLKDSTLNFDFIPLPPIGHYEFKEEPKEFSFTIPFEQGKFNFTKEDIDPFLNSMTDLSIRIDSIRIKAFSSVEGDSVSNHNLQNKRAGSIAEVIRSDQKEYFPIQIETKSDWPHFNHFLKNNPDWKHLRGLKGQALQNEIFKNIKELEPILSSERRAEIKLYTTIRNDRLNLKYLIEKEWKELSELSKRNGDLEHPESPIRKLERLYDYMHFLAFHNIIEPSYFSKFILPESYKFNHELVQKFFAYGKEFETEFKKNNDQWVSNNQKDLNTILGECEKHLIDGFLYIAVREKAIKILDNKTLEYKEQLKDLYSFLNRIHKFYEKDTLNSNNIDRMLFSLNYFALNHIYNMDPMKFRSNAGMGIYQIQNYYEKNAQMDYKRALELANMSVYYFNIPEAISILNPYKEQDSVLNFIIPLGYQHISTPGSLFWYEELLEYSSTMSNNTWCNMFLNNCKIPFQAFDHEELRNVFCSKCLQENVFLQELLNPTRK